MCRGHEKYTILVKVSFASDNPTSGMRVMSAAGDLALQTATEVVASNTLLSFVRSAVTVLEPSPVSLSEICGATVNFSVDFDAILCTCVSSPPPFC